MGKKLLSPWLLTPVVILVIFLAVIGILRLKTSSTTVTLGANGCDPGTLVIPSGHAVLHVTNKGNVGEFEIRDEQGNSKAKVAPFDGGQTNDIHLNLKTGYYTVDCGSDNLISRLTVGAPKEAPINLGSVVAPTAKAPRNYSPKDGNSYASKNLVASDASYDPLIVDPTMVDAWGLANRPAGAGGHFWITANRTGDSLEYVGDVGGAPLYQNNLQTVSIPGTANTWSNSPDDALNRGQPTGVVFNPYSDKFVVDQGAISGAAKFIFAGQDGTISAWTEQNNPDGSVTQLAWATKVADQSPDPTDFIHYFGLAIAPGGDRLLGADFGSNPQIRSFDSSFKPVPTVGFKNPFVKSGAAIKPTDLIPWNVTTLGDKVYVCYAEAGVSETGFTRISLREENHAPGAGKVVEYNADGSMDKILKDKGSLDAPWGIAIAPPGFGKLTGDTLVANFGDGSIAAFTPDGSFADWVRKPNGSVLVVPGVWALLPGNGSGLGSAKDVYFTAGPDAEQAGVFGKIQTSD